jgi:hypothetical protein
MGTALSLVMEAVAAAIASLRRRLATAGETVFAIVVLCLRNSGVAALMIAATSAAQYVDGWRTNEMV